jgi:hypothetical protein
LKSKLCLSAKGRIMHSNVRLYDKIHPVVAF